MTRAIVSAGRNGYAAPSESWKLPPQNLEAEQSVLGAILIDNSVLHEIVAFLKPDHFYRANHQVLYQAILALYARHEPVDVITLCEQLQREGQLADIGGEAAVVQCMTSVPHSANGVYHARIVLAKAITRALVEVSDQIRTDCYSDRFTAEELVESAERAVFSLAEQEVSSQSSPLKAITTAAVGRLLNRKRGPSGISVGLARLDAMLDGFQPEQLVILAARPSMGKTQLALNFLEYVTLRRRDPVLFCSLEMSQVEIGERLLVTRSGVPNWKWKSPDEMSPDERGRIDAAQAEYDLTSGIIDDAPARTTLQLLSNARRWKSRLDIKMVIVDYLQLISGAGRSRDNREQVVAQISRDLKAMARELKVPVLCLAQLNRACEDRPDHRPRISDLRESGAIEQDADAVLLLYRPDYYNPLESPELAELIVAKNRNGSTGLVKMRFRKEIGRFEDWSGPPLGADAAPPGPEF